MMLWNVHAVLAQATIGLIPFFSSRRVDSSKVMRDAMPRRAMEKRVSVKLCLKLFLVLLAAAWECV